MHPARAINPFRMGKAIRIESEVMDVSSTRERSRTTFTDLDNGTYWQIERDAQPHDVWYSVLHDGWVVWELRAKEYIEGIEVRSIGRPREKIPEYVMSHLPKVT